MSQVRQAGTAPEEAVAGWLRSHGICYRRNVNTLPGTPDFANRRAGFAIFVHGCFWHRHLGCRRATIPARNSEFWRAKFDANVVRDAERIKELRTQGFHVITVWECETQDPSKLSQRLDRVVSAAISA